MNKVVVSKIREFFDKGNADLVERVPTIIREASESAINGEVQLREAWASCYSVNPDYEKTVSKCCDVLEKIWRDKYFPKDPTPNIAKFVASFKTDASKLSYKGSSIADPKNLLTNLAEKFSSIRGQHTAGTGRAPTKEEAEFVLHYSIFVWNSER